MVKAKEQTCMVNVKPHVALISKALLHSKIALKSVVALV